MSRLLRGSHARGGRCLVLWALALFGRLLRADRRLGLGGCPPARDDAGEPARRHVEHGREDEAEEGDTDHAGEDRGPESPGALGAGPDGPHERHHAEDERERRHQDRPQAQRGPPRGSRSRAVTACAARLRELDDQDGVLRRKADQRDQPTLVDSFGLPRSATPSMEAMRLMGTTRMTASGIDQLSTAQRARGTRSNTEARNDPRARRPHRFNRCPVHSIANPRRQLLAESFSSSIASPLRCPARRPVQGDRRIAVVTCDARRAGMSLQRDDRRQRHHSPLHCARAACARRRARGGTRNLPAPSRGRYGPTD